MILPELKLNLNFHIILILIATSSCMDPATKSEITRPNIVVILVDDMRWDEFGLAGHNYIKTPNIDRIAREGIYFRNAFTTTPLCSPSRASFLTGQYAHTNGITDNLARNEQSHRLKTFPLTLDSAGYETAFIGKWHMGNDDSQRPGFDTWVALEGQGEAINPNLNINGDKKNIEGYVTDVLTEFSTEFISAQRSQPFLLYLSHKALHPNMKQKDDGSVEMIGSGGFIPAERHTGMYGDKVFQRRPNAYLPPKDKPSLMRQIDALPQLGRETATDEKTIRERSEMLMAVDESLGRIIDQLEESNLLENTIIVFTSDHGYWYGEHGLSVERRLAYEEAIRIPMLIRYPRVFEPGQTNERMILSIDLAPTLLDLAGLIPGAHIHGRSMVPLMNGKTQDWRSSFLIEYYSDTVFPRILKMGYKAVRNERYKYIRYLDLKNMDELYDLTEDPYELNNIHDAPGSEEVLKVMKAELNRLLLKTDGAQIGS
ncbi:MAG TPA: sulfatase [Cyclobacteriaceae bacterium]